MLGGREVAQWIGCLLHKCKDMSSNPRLPIKSVVGVVASCNPNDWEVETGAAWGKLTS